MLECLCSHRDVEPFWKKCHLALLQMSWKTQGRGQKKRRPEFEKLSSVVWCHLGMKGRPQDYRVQVCVVKGPVDMKRHSRRAGNPVRSAEHR